jgi:uncharacterized protein YpmB
LTWKRTLVIGIFIIGTLIFVLSRFYLNVQGEHWNENTKAVETAFERTILAKATTVESFYGDEPYQVIFGEDKIGQKVIVWVSNKEVHTEMSADGFTEQQVREVMSKKGPENEILRIMPGKMQNKYVWEVFYKKNDPTGMRYFYDYYNFQDGTYIDTYRLSLQ